MNIILASNSPRRKELLSSMIRDFYIVPSTIDEKTIKETNPELLVKKLSLLKANDVFSRALYNAPKEGVVIAADTIVYFQGEILGKPKNEKEAKTMLCSLQGKENDVYTGMSVIIKKEHTIVTKTVACVSRVYFKPMSNTDILEYIATKEPLDKAGAYAVQGIGRNYIKGYDGNYNGIIGLNMDQLADIFSQYHVTEEEAPIILS